MTTDITWVTTELPDCIIGIPYVGGLVTTGQASALSAGSVTSGALPTSANLIVNANHTEITGTAKPVDVGLYTFKVSITDTGGAVQSGTLKLNVRFIVDADLPGLVAAGVTTAQIAQAFVYKQWPTFASDT